MKVLAILSALLLSSSSWLLLAEAAGQVTQPPCVAKFEGTSGGPNTKWNCPYEASKWIFTVTIATPTNGSCGPPPEILATACNWSEVTISLQKLSSGTASLPGGTRRGTGDIDTSNPPVGAGSTGVVNQGGPQSVSQGGTATFRFTDQDVTCGRHRVLDVSYSPSNCPATPETCLGWGPCSIINVFLICGNCTQSGGGGQLPG